MSKRIALFSPSLDGGGAERVMMNLARGFVDRGYPVDLVLSSASGEYLAQLDSRVRLVDLRARRVATSLPALIKYLRTQRPSTLLSTQAHANVIALMAASFAGIETRIVVRDSYSTAGESDCTNKPFAVGIISWLTRHYYPKADGIVALCEDLKSEIAITSRVPSEKITVIYNPIAVDEILKSVKEPSGHDWLDSPSRKVVLSIGRLEEQKDFFTLIRAFSIVRQGIDVSLLILGEGSLRPQLTELVSSLKLDSCVDLPGFVNNPHSYISRADTFVLSSLFEGLPNALLEALAIGTPIVATDCKTGPRELLRGGKDGILVPIRDPLALAKGITNSLTTKIRAQAAPESLQRFEVQHVIDQYLDLLCPND